ncbi:protein phosphatase 2C domain-containing protein [Candidatus Epulonipiscium viviparus]|uniref:protein phosphatase 2C domain-containing protein n=1 Tax=Candidatus Epulonipiscium viviparus TaxID=420336 RepID=UPI00273807A7|nr:protein phosphatase 2C domain-containing protein [Candidatus Epulopiscium viviparus]
MLFTFNQTVLGHSHFTNNQICQDYSTSYSNVEMGYHIAVVADGHGSDECFRSNTGARFAAKTALSSLKKLAELIFSDPESADTIYEDLFHPNPRRQIVLSSLTQTIVAKWNDKITTHYNNNPILFINEDYLSFPPRDFLVQSSPTYPPSIYGTTLIAALQLPNCLILLQQGDGRCIIFYEDGTADQPIPSDVRCTKNITTSICDPDAAASMQFTVINLKEKNIAACFLGTDGVEDTYPNTFYTESFNYMKGVHTFYKHVCVQIIEKTYNFNKYFKKQLTIFSKNGLFSSTGSGDDISVSGIVDLQKISALVDQFKTDVAIYKLEEELLHKENQLYNKDKEYDILKKKFETAQSERLNFLQDLSIFIPSVEQLNHLSLLTQNLATAEQNFSEYKYKYNKLLIEYRNLEQQLIKLF